MPRHRARTAPYLELRPRDYKLLEAAAVTALHRMGLSGRWPVEDLVTVGWERVFWYTRTYEEFERKGFLRCIDHCRWHVQKQRAARARQLCTTITLSECEGGEEDQP